MSEWIVSDGDLGCDGEYLGYKELVRCYECKWHFTTSCPMVALTEKVRGKSGEGSFTGNNCYCSFGVRKEKE